MDNAIRSSGSPANHARPVALSPRPHGMPAQGNQPPTLAAQTPQTGGPIMSTIPASHSAYHAVSATRPLLHAAPGQLHKAAMDGEGDTVKRLLAGNEDTNATDPVTGLTALMLAARHGHDDVLVLLMRGRQTQDIHRQTTQGDTALSLAAHAGHVDAVELLLHKKAPQQHRDHALSKAAAAGHLAVMRLLLEMGARVNHAHAAGATPLHMAAGQGQHAAAKALIEAGADRARRDATGRTAADIAQGAGHQYLATLLSAEGAVAASTAMAASSGSTATVPETTAAITTATSNSSALSATPWVQDAVADFVGFFTHRGERTSRQSPISASSAGPHGVSVMQSELHARPAQLREAAVEGSGDTVKRLLSARVDLNVLDPASGLSALMLAASYGHDHVVVLRTKGQQSQDIHRQTAQGDTALSLAAAAGHADVVELLLHKKAPQQHMDHALSRAAAAGHIAAIRLLLEQGARVNHAQADGATPLHMAARQGKYDAVNTLLEAGADRARRDAKGWAAADVAARAGHHWLVHLLSAGAAEATLTSLMDAVAETTAGVTRATLTSSSSSAVAPPGVADALSHASFFIMHLGQSPAAMLLDAAEGNDAMALRGLVDEIRCCGIDLHHELNRAGKLRKAASSSPAERELTPLMVAAHLGHMESVRILLEAGAGVDQVDCFGSTALMHAAHSGHMAIVQMLLKAGARVGQALFDGRTALMWAAHYGETSTVESMLQAGAKVNHIGRDGWTALTCAASRGHARTMQALLKADAWLGQATVNGWTALMWAVENGHAASVQLLLEQTVEGNDAEVLNRLLDEMRRCGMDLPSELNRARKLCTAANSRFEGKELTLLMSAAHLGHSRSVLVLVLAGAAVDLAASDGETALMLGAKKGHTATVLTLLKAGAKVNHATTDGWTALMVAAISGHANTVNALLAEGANVNQARPEGTTALMLAAGGGDTDTVQALLQSGAKVEQATVSGMTALMWAAQFDKAAAVQALLQAGAKVNQATSKGINATNCLMTAKAMCISASNDPTSLEGVFTVLGNLFKLTHAALLCATPVQQSACLKDAGVDQKEIVFGWTPLMLASEGGPTSTVLALLQAGAWINQAASNGMTALMLAAYSGRAETVQALLAKGANVHQTDCHGNTALKFAERAYQSDIAETLREAGARKKFWGWFG